MARGRRAGSRLIPGNRRSPGTADESRPGNPSPTTARAEQRLILVIPPDVTAERAIDALGGGDVAAIVIDPEATDPESLLKAAQAADVAVLVSAATWPVPYGADGLHLPPEIGAEAVLAALKTRPGGAMCGAAALSKHEAMLAGEAGSDYVWFGGAADAGTACSLATWWQSLFEVPAVVAGRSDAVALAAMIETRAEFVAIVDAFSSSDAEAPDHRVARVNAALAAGPGAL